MSGTTRVDLVQPDDGASAAPPVPMLEIAWSWEEPGRIGEVARLPLDGPSLLGRGAEARSGEHQLEFLRLRPGMVTSPGPLAAVNLSRRQLLLLPRRGGAFEARNLGRAPMYFLGRRTDSALVRSGVLRIGRGLVLRLTERRSRLPTPSCWDRAHEFGFGEADPFGMVGESEPFWALREQLAFCARRPVHVLITGESGTGKELAARALHGMSARASGPLVARNAATIPGSLIDAELFGNERNYPNPGMKERPGLVGESDGGTLFLDEIGELPLEHQAHLLRVLDSGGEYQRLGEPRTRRSEFRLVAATNRDVEAIKHDLRARMVLRVDLKPLHQRPSDVPLLARHLLGRIAADNPDIRDRFFADGRPRVEGELIEALMRHTFTTHARELERLLWTSLSSSPGDALRLTGEVRELLGETEEPVAQPDDDLPGAAEIRDSLERHGFVQSKVWKELGLKNRFQLRRLIEKYGIELPRR